MVGRDLLEKALAIRSRAQGYGEDTLNAADWLASLLDEHALLLKDRNELARAAPLYLRALEVHWHTGTVLCALGHAMHGAGDTAAATRLFDRALEIRSGILGTNHLDTVATRRDLDRLGVGTNSRDGGRFRLGAGRRGRDADRGAGLDAVDFR